MLTLTGSALLHASYSVRPTKPKTLCTLPTHMSRPQWSSCAADLKAIVYGVTKATKEDIKLGPPMQSMRARETLRQNDTTKQAPEELTHTSDEDMRVHGLRTHGACGTHENKHRYSYTAMHMKRVGRRRKTKHGTLCIRSPVCRIF